MFQVSNIRLPQHRRHNNLRTFVTSSFSSPNDTKEPSRRGLMFIVVAGVLLLVGSFLTWFGFNDVFGGKIVIGPLLIALALILLLVCTRQFFKARKHNRNRLQLGPIGQATLRAVVVDHNDGLGAVTFIMDPLDVDNTQNQPNRLLPYDASVNQSNRFPNMENYAPPSYSEVAEINGTNLSPYSPHNQDEPPPPYVDAILSPNSDFTLHLPKYEAIGGRRSPVPKYEDIFVTPPLPGLVPPCYSPSCLSHTHYTAPHQISCHVCVSCTPSQSVLSNSNSPSASAQCIHVTANQGHMHGNNGQQPSTCCSHRNTAGQGQDMAASPTPGSQGQTVAQVERENSNFSQCTIQSTTCCPNHSPCGNGQVTSCSCSPHQVMHQSMHFTFPCTQSICPCSNHSTQLINQNQISGSTNPVPDANSLETTMVSATDTCNMLHNGGNTSHHGTENTDQSNLFRDTGAPIRTFGTPTQDTEHTF